MNGTKNPLQSWAIVAPLVMMIVYFLNQNWPGLFVTEAEVAYIIDAFDVALGGVVAIYGRWTAVKKVTLTGS